MQPSESRSKWRIWILAVRPKTLWAAISPVIIGTAMAVDSGGFHLISALAALFGGVFIQIGTNLANDYFDYKKGADNSERLGPMRVTQAGLVTPSEIKSAAAISFSIALLFGIYLVMRCGWPIAIMGLSSIFCGVIYTAGPFALSYKGLGDLFVLIFFGPVAVGGTYFAQTLTIEWPVVVAGIAPGLLSVAILTVNNLRDVKSDEQVGKKTLVVRFGTLFSKSEYVSAIFIASVIPLVMWSISRTHLLAIVTILLVPLALPDFKKVLSESSGGELNQVLASTGRLLFLYSLLFSFGWLL